jgi:hypothetical protein
MGFATEMHEKNKGMQTQRKELEKKLKKELLAKDVAYQIDAFTFLPETKKASMFDNAKLKDEVKVAEVQTKPIWILFYSFFSFCILNSAYVLRCVFVLQFISRSFAL